MTTTERIDTHLDKIGITDRAELPSGSFPLTLHLRAHRIDARYALDARRAASSRCRKSTPPPPSS